MAEDDDLGQLAERITSQLEAGLALAEGVASPASLDRAAAACRALVPALLGKRDSALANSQTALSQTTTANGLVQDGPHVRLEARVSRWLDPPAPAVPARVTTIAANGGFYTGPAHRAVAKVTEEAMEEQRGGVDVRRGSTGYATGSCARQRDLPFR